MRGPAGDELTKQIMWPVQWDGQYVAVFEWIDKEETTGFLSVWHPDRNRRGMVKLTMKELIETDNLDKFIWDHVFNMAKKLGYTPENLNIIKPDPGWPLFPIFQREYF